MLLGFSCRAGCMQPGVLWTPPPMPLPDSPLSLGFPWPSFWEKNIVSPKICVFSSWGGVAAVTAQLPVYCLPAGCCVILSKWIPSL